MELEKQLKEMQVNLDAKFELAEKQAKENAGKVSEDLKNEIKSLEGKYTEINKRIDESEVALQKEIRGATEAKEVKGFQGALKSQLKGEEYEAIKSGKIVTLDLKADMTVGADFTGDVIAPDRAPGIKADPTRAMHIRDLLSKGSTTSDVIHYSKESAYSNGAATTAEGATATQSDADFAQSSANVYKIATYFRVSEEMIADAPQIISFLAARAPEKLLTVEDTKLLSGSGVSDISGIITDATAFAAGDFALAIESANEFDVMAVAVNQLALSEYRPDYFVMNPTDFTKMLLLKDTTNNYLQDQVYRGLNPNVLGVPVVINTAIAAGTFLVGNFAMGTQLWQRQGLSVTFHDQDGTNVRDGFVTIKVQERIALTNYLPGAFITGSFATAKAALETV